MNLSQITDGGGCILAAGVRLVVTAFVLVLAQSFFSSNLTFLAAAQPVMNVTRVASGLTRPVFGTTAPGAPNQFFIVEQRTGTTANIKILDLNSGTVNAQAFLTISGVSSGREQGLLGLAFHPDYASNGLFYVNFTNASGNTVIREYERQTSATADANSGRIIMSINQPFSNHNGGWLGFDNNGFLLIASGDGGSGGDPKNNAQTITDNLLGKILRIDVNGDDFAEDPDRNYAIPNSNPFVGIAGDDEIWAYGLRNPWRPSFDRQTGDFYIADVGQGSLEEINIQPASSAGGESQ